MLKDQRHLLRIFNEREVEYLIVGGHAAIAYGSARLTEDIDIWIRRDIDNSRRVFAALASFGAPLAGMKPEDFNLGPDEIYMFGRKPARIDILQGIENVDFDAAWQRRVLMEVEPGFTCPYLSLDDLLVNKSAVARPKDIADLVELQKVKRLRES